MTERTTTEVAKIYRHAGHSVDLINNETSKHSDEAEQDWKDRIKRNWRHLEIIKAYKKADKTTSIWTTEDFTAIDAAITKGKLVQPN